MRKFLSVMSLCLVMVMIFTSSCLAEIEPNTSFTSDDVEIASLSSAGPLIGSGTNGDFDESDSFTITATGSPSGNDHIRIQTRSVDGASTVLIRVYHSSNMSYAVAVGTLGGNDTDTFDVINHNNGNVNVNDTCTYVVEYTVVGGTVLVTASFNRD